MKGTKKEKGERPNIENEMGREIVNAWVNPCATYGEANSC
jgi:hypothetical protein